MGLQCLFENSFSFLSFYLVRRNKTALMYACINGHSQLVAHLLRIGVDPNAVDSSENTPIHYASAYGWYHCVQLLLEGGADPNTPNNWKVVWVFTAKNTVISPNFLAWTFCGKAQFPHSFANRSKLCGNCAFPQSSHTRKLGEITVFYVVFLLAFCQIFTPFRVEQALCIRLVFGLVIWMP